MKHLIRFSVFTAWLVMGIPGLTNAEIRIGSPLALSGSVAALAADMKLGIELAVKQVNDQGGLLDQEYKMIFADSACNPDKAVDVVTKLIEDDKVSALVGPVCSGATLRQARSVSIPSGVTTISVASAASLISRLRDNDLVFRTAIADPFKGEVMAEYAIKNGIRNIAVSFANDAYNTGIAQVFSNAFKAKGGVITVSQAHQPDRPNYDREAQALLSGSRNIALFAYYGSGGTQMLTDLLSTGNVDNVFATDGMLSNELVQVLGVEALRSTKIFNNSSDNTRKAFQLWRDFTIGTNIPPSGAFVANAYDAAFMIALAIQAVGSAQKTEIPRGLRLISGPDGETIYPGEFEKAKRILSEGGNINYEGASGPVDFDKNGDISGFIGINQVVDGEWKSTLFHQ